MSIWMNYHVCAISGKHMEFHVLMQLFLVKSSDQITCGLYNHIMYCQPAFHSMNLSLNQSPTKVVGLTQTFELSNQTQSYCVPLNAHAFHIYVMKWIVMPIAQSKVETRSGFDGIWAITWETLQKANFFEIGRREKVIWDKDGSGDDLKP